MTEKEKIVLKALKTSKGKRMFKKFFKKILFQQIKVLRGE